MNSLSKTEEIKKLEAQQLKLLKQMLHAQSENVVLYKEINGLKEKTSVMSSSLAEYAVLQNFLVEQLTSTHEIVVEIDKLLHPKNYLKYDLMNEPYN